MKIEIHGPNWGTPKTITASAAMAGMTDEQIRSALKGTHPEVTTTTVSREERDGETVVKFLAAPGRKG